MFIALEGAGAACCRLILRYFTARAALSLSQRMASEADDFLSGVVGGTWKDGASA